jgi:hypothetical protein
VYGALPWTSITFYDQGNATTKECKGPASTGVLIGYSVNSFMDCWSKNGPFQHVWIQRLPDSSEKEWEVQVFDLPTTVN